MTREARYLALRIYVGTIQKMRNFYGTQYKKREPVLMTWRDLASPYAFDGSEWIKEICDAGLVTRCRDGVKLKDAADLSLRVCDFEKRLQEL